MKGKDFIEKLCSITIGKQNMRLLARQTGVSANVISCIKNSQQACHFNSEQAELIVSRFPHVNRLWLLEPDKGHVAEVEAQEIGISAFARIEAIARHYGLSVPQLEKAIGVSENHLYNLKSRTKSISVQLFGKFIEHYPELNPDWLSSGRGDMLLPEPQKPVDPDTLSLQNMYEDIMRIYTELKTEHLELKAAMAEARMLIKQLRSMGSYAGGYGMVGEEPQRDTNI